VDPVSATPNFVSLPTPDGLKFTEWAQIAVEQLASYGLQNAPEEVAWQTWAASFIDGTMPGSPAPSPSGFSSWQEWAYALIGTIS
jgi:hypothetical protein